MTMCFIYFVFNYVPFFILLYDYHPFSIVVALWSHLEYENYLWPTNFLILALEVESPEFTISVSSFLFHVYASSLFLFYERKSSKIL